MADNKNLIEQSGYDAYTSTRTSQNINSTLENVNLNITNTSSSNDNSWLDSSSSVETVVSSSSNAFEGTEVSAEMLETIDTGMASVSSSSSKNGIVAAMKAVKKFITGAMDKTVNVLFGTSYGSEMETSWSKFFSAMPSLGSISTDTPLGSSTSASAVYGNLILGTPPGFTSVADPNNRTTINSFAKDMRFLSLTPGTPKFNGGYSEQLMYNQTTYSNVTKTPKEMLDYLKKNGIDTDFASKDKRYYTFQSKFEEYYAYLETMLNTIWIKLGLGTEGSKTNIMTFFNADSSQSDLQAQYKTALGFYIQGAPQVSEDITNSELSNSLESDVNNTSDKFQQLNYLTGMGSVTGTAMRHLKGAQKLTGTIFHQASTFKSTFYDPLFGTLSTQNGFLKNIAALTKNIAEMTTVNDLSAMLQQFAVTNGMKVRYPNLWSDSQYSKNLNFDFDFVSPYGDPLSIFHYVYVPFMALLCFAMPRQAASNGFISPFFVRADIPGHFTSDLAIVSNVTWQKGGSSGNLFTKDGLPRAIHVSITISDLYPYLAMTKRLSFLSANPSYTVFLDSMAGLHAQYEDNADNDMLNNYFKDMLNRVSGNSDYAGTSRINGLSNDYSKTVFKNARDSGYNNKSAKPLSGNIGSFSTPWFTKK